MRWIAEAVCSSTRRGKMRTKKTGAALDLFIMSKCAELLMEVPPKSRSAICEWLKSRVADIQTEPAQPATQEELFPS